MATFNVTTARDEVADDGQLSLREAVTRANAAPGADAITFAPRIEGERLVLEGGQLVVTDDLRIDGNRDDNRSEVTLDADGDGRVLTIGGTATRADLHGLTITGGRLPDAAGGGILLGSGNDLNLTACTVEENSVGGFVPPGIGNYQYGGGIYAEAGSRLTITDSLVRGNDALGFGGGIAGRGDASVTIRGSEILANYAYRHGGGIDLAGGCSLSIAESAIRNNTAPNDGGGGLFLAGSTATITESAIVDNVAPGIRPGAAGGGIRAFGGTVELVAATLAGNYAIADGGGLFAQGTDVRLRDSTVTGNTAYSRGGGLVSNHFRTADTYLPGLLDLANSIVAGNIAGRPGYTARDDISSTVTASNGHNIFGSAVTGEVSGDLEGVASARLFASLDPGTGGGRLALSGGPTPTARLRDAQDNPALSGADPLDAGAVDQRGVGRPLPPATNPDIGAFELDQRQVSRSPSPNNDVVTGTARGDTLAPLAGNDLARGLGGDDTLQGGLGGDTLEGGPGADRLDGGLGRDLLRGGFGDDRLAGGPGADLLRGGTGRDLLDIDPGDSGVGAGRRDLVADFRPGADRIDLATIDAVIAGGDNAFAFVGRQAFTGAGQLRFAQAGGDTLVQGSTDADRAPEFELQLAGAVALGGGDFVL